MVVVVDVVSHADELHVVVAARQQQHGHAEDVALGDAADVWRIRLEHELVRTHGDGADEDGVQDLVVRVALGAADVRQLPLEVCVRCLGGRDRET